MLNYLDETYGGAVTNTLPNSAYYCYTIKDIDSGNFYSGSRGVEGGHTHDLLVKYFTSSTVLDFKEKLKNFPESFEYRIEYFETRQAAFIAEKLFHQLHNVGKNPNFINSMNSGGTNCGAGSVLCKDASGNTYRVTVEEFNTGKHVHISKGMMNIRTDEGIKKIYTKDFDPDIHTTEFQDHILALNTETGKKCRIARSEFESDSKYVGVTKGMVVVYDVVTGERKSVTQSEFNNSNGRLVGNTFGMVPVIDKLTGKSTLIEKEKYDKAVYRHHNTGNVVVYSIPERKIVKINKEEYQANIDDYANQSTKVFYKVDGKFFKSKDQLDDYYRRTRGKTILKTSQYALSAKFKDIESITKEEHANGKK